MAAIDAEDHQHLQGGLCPRAQEKNGDGLIVSGGLTHHPQITVSIQQQALQKFDAVLPSAVTVPLVVPILIGDLP